MGDEGGLLLQFRILGPLEVVRGDECLPFRGSRERAVLALLALHANRTVSVERLAEDLWSGDPPEAAIRSLRVYVSRLRQALGAAGQAVVTRRSGYLLQVDPATVDALRFEELVARGRDQAKAGDHSGAAATLREALGLWRGPALADLADAPFAQAQASRLEEARLCALEDRIEADLVCGRHGEVTAELQTLTGEHPLRERLWSQRMVALYRSGRQADALRVYQALRSTLRAQLGLEPSSAVQQLEGDILRHDPKLDWQPMGLSRPGAGRQVEPTAAAETIPSVATTEPGPLPQPSAPLSPIGAPTALAVPPRRRSRRGASVFVGREREIARLDAQLARVEAGELRCVLITGEPGVGKTRLADEFAVRHGGSTPVVSARAYPLGGTSPFSLWIEALEPALATMRPVDVDRLCGDFVDDLGGLFHSVATLRRGPPTGERPRLRLLEGLARILEAFSSDHPTIAVLDDVHLADPSSWDVLRHLARCLPDLPLLVLATARAGELAANDVAAQVLLELEQDGGLSRLDLGPLERADLGALAEVTIGRVPPPALISWLEDRTRGNALFAQGLLRALLEEDADLAVPRLERLPESLTERVIRRLKDLNEAERTTLELIAVLGRPLALGELVLMTGRTLEDLARILATLLSVGAIVEEERGRDLSYEIHHPLVRDVIYRAIGGARRRLLHRQVAAVLRSGGRIGEAARHFARSAEVGDPDAIDALRAAVYQAEARAAYREALELLGELGELLPCGDPRWLEVSEAMSWRAEWVVDHRADAHALQGIRALRELDGLLTTSSDPARRAAVKFRLANFLAWGTGELEQAESTLTEAAALFDKAGDRRDALLSERELAWVRGLQGDFDTMEVNATRVAEAAITLGDRFLEMQALTAAGYASGFQGQFRASEDRLRRALTIAQEDLKTYRHTALAAMLAGIIALEGRTEEAMSLISEAKAADSAYRDTVLLELETKVRWLAGDYPGALASAGEAVAWSPGLSRRRSIGGAFAALAALEAGQTTEAQQFLDRAMGALGGRNWSIFTQLCGHAEGVLASQQGRTGEALAALRGASSAMLERGAYGYVVFSLVDLAELEAAVGDGVAALAAAAHLHDIADRTKAEMHGGLAALASSWAALAAGDVPAAATAARAAIAALSASGWRALLARAHDALGRATSAADRPVAVDSFARAVDLFEAAGAIPRRDLAVEQLRTLGSPGRRAAAAAGGPGSLTAREREVARLAADGASAKEIAGRLFVSERTIETHLTRVYAKLGVTGKVELVRRADEMPL